MEIRVLETIDALSEISRIEETVWGMPPLPVHQTLTAVKNGGLVIAAYDADRIIGFSYGFAGFKDGRVYLCSHMLGIDEGYRSQKIGEKLKRKQRESSVEKGYEEIRWTYDPLETRNAFLNLTKLNGVCTTYIEDAYGEMKDGINRGLPSDRFEVHWHINSPHVQKPYVHDTSGTVKLNDISYNAAGLPVCEEVSYNDLEKHSYAIKVPKDFQNLKKHDTSLALYWRYRTRTLFQALFKAGYAAVNLEVLEKEAVYIFVKKDSLNLKSA